MGKAHRNDIVEGDHFGQREEIWVQIVRTVVEVEVITSPPQEERKGLAPRGKRGMGEGENSIRRKILHPWEKTAVLSVWVNDEGKFDVRVLPQSLGQMISVPTNAGKVIGDGACVEQDSNHDVFLTISLYNEKRATFTPHLA